MTNPEPDEETVVREASRVRRQNLIEAHGAAEWIADADALALAAAAGVQADPAVTANDVYASIYRDDAAADAYVKSNLAHHGHPTLAKVPLPDGRVLGILDLRPALERARREAAEGES